MSENDYDCMFYQEILLNSGESIFENVTDKDTLRFQDPIQAIHDEQFLFLCQRQSQYQVLQKNQVRLSLLNYLALLLLMIFPLHFERQTLLYSTFSLVLFLILIYHLSFVYLFFLWTHARLPRMCQSIVYFRLDSGDAGGDNDLKTEKDFRVSHTFIEKENC